MKCPSCGAEVEGSKCSFCGSELPKQPINIINNYYGSAPSQPGERVGSTAITGASCPNCGSNKISFQRESAGTRGLHKTIGMCKNCGNTWVTSQDVISSSKSRTVALVLCICLGYLGVHHFYVGRSGMGWLYLFTMGLFGFGWIFDIVMLAKGDFKDGMGYPLH